MMTTEGGHLPSSMAFITALFILNMMPGLLGLKDVEIIVPKYVRRGADVLLSCHYDLEKESLYAVKFYKERKEFYRYLPKEKPNEALAFNMPGIYVDVALSNDHDVLLRNVSLLTTGVYRCSVAAEFPFETKENATDLSVVVISDDPPILHLVEIGQTQSYHPGDVISAQCQTPPSFPPAEIIWYFNDVKDPGRVLKTETRKDVKDPLTKSTLSTISFDLPAKMSPVRIYCQARILNVYDKKSNVTTIQPIPGRLTGTENLLRSGSSRASTEFSLLFFLSGFVVNIVAYRNTYICSMLKLLRY